MADRLTEIGRCYGIETSVKKLRHWESQGNYINTDHGKKRNQLENV